MRSLLTNALLFHWTVLFAALALVCVLDPEAGLRAPLGLLGMDASAGEPRFALGSAAVFGSGFLLSATLYLWAFLCAVAGEGASTEATRLAFAVAVVVLTALFVACAFRGVDGLTAGLGLLLAASLASYLVIASESRRLAAGELSPPTTARFMATEAAQSSSLRRPPGHPPAGNPEGQT